ncbi:MAG TPA: hypothetical protein VGB79_05765 [Allosphingosinicella sp.]|jgi:hypothetical protein
MNEHELGFVTFLAEPTRRRVLALLELGPKRRKDVRALLDHAVTLDLRYAHRLEGGQASACSVAETLRDHGAPATCDLVSADAALDGREMPLSDAVEAVSGSFHGGFVSCIPGTLGYFEHEDVKSAYLLRR